MNLHFLQSMKLWQSFCLLAVMGFLMVAPPLYFYIAEANVKVSFSQTEQAGIQPGIFTLKLLQNIQQHRGLTAAFLGSGKMGDQRSAKQAEVELLLTKTETLLPRNDSISHTMFTAIINDWRSLNKSLTASTLSVPDSYKKHTEICEQLLLLTEQIADNFGLSLDPDADTYYLIRTIYFDLPRLTEDLGQMRAKGAGFLATKEINTEGRAIMLSLITKASVSNTRMLRSFEKAYRANETIKHKFGGQVVTASTIANEAIALAQTKVATSELIDYPAVVKWPMAILLSKS